MEKKASNQDYFRERIAILSFYIACGDLAESDVEEAYKNPDNSWHERLEEMERQYRYVDICNIFNDRIGELIPRYIYAVKNRESIPGEKLEIFIGVRGWCNQSLKKILERHITIIDFSDKFWIYFILTYSGTISVENENKYNDREDYDRAYFAPDKTACLFGFSDSEIQYAKNKAMEAGIKEPFICFANRDSAYLDSMYPQGDWSYHNYRDSHIENYELMTSSFGERNISTVRMGKAVLKRATFNNCIDFSCDHYDELLDIYLMSKCKFFVGDESGINVLPRALNKPVVTTNLVTVTGYGGIPLREDNLFIFKKFYDVHKDRFLSLKEMLDVLIDCKYDTKEFDKRSIKLIENTPEEIRDVAIEMDEYLDGTSAMDEEGEALQSKASKILRNHFEKSGLGFNETLVGKIGKTFLKDNRYLLEEL